MNRRFFLKGLGSAALALPVLPSLLPRAAWGQSMTAPRRYVQIMNPYGPTAATFYGSLSGGTQAAPNVSTRLLSDVVGPLSSILGTSFDAVRGKTNVLRGFDVPVNNPNHQFCFATCASGYAPGLDGDGYPPQSNNESIDVILSNNAKSTPASFTAARRLLNFNPLNTDDYSSNRSFSWRRGNSLQMVSPLKTTTALLNLFMGSFGMATMPVVDTRELTLVQAVHADFVRVRSNPQLSAGDRQKLDAYMALIDDLEREASMATMPGPVVCAAPTPDPGTGDVALVRTQLRVLAAAMACDLTRVGSVTLGMSASYDTRHTEHHAMNGMNVAAGILGDLRGFAAHVGWFCQHLDSITEGTGTVLDNSIVYWSSQYGCALVNSQHEPRDMPVLVAGKGGGALSTGQYMDFRSNGVGLPLNNLLVTFFNAMGLSSGDYEQNGNTGYGLYTSNMMSGRSDAAQWTATAGRRSALPVLYTGPAMG
ncbi:MAG: DUF1552 domain-containing protein [Archangium sp.]